ncbi:MAG: class I SAM-dependent methyltransferase [Myxococcota bacterium]
MNQTENFWDASADNYDRTEERFEAIHRRSRENARRHVKPTDVVLDYGCGTGTTACDLAPRVKSVHGIDISSKMVDLAQQKAREGGIGNATFARVDIFDGSFEAESFDVILAFNILHTIPDPQASIRRMHALLKPNGVMISVTPAFRDRSSLLGFLQIMLVRTLCLLGVISIPIRSVSRSDLEQLVQQSGGFIIIDDESIFRGTSSHFMVAQKAAGPVAAEV